MYSYITLSPTELACLVTDKLNHNMICVTVLFCDRFGQVRITNTTNISGALSDAQKEDRLQAVTKSYTQLFAEGFLPLVIFTVAPSGAVPLSAAGLQELLTQHEDTFATLCECTAQADYGAFLGLKYSARCLYSYKLKAKYLELASAQAAAAEMLAAGGYVKDFNSTHPIPATAATVLWRKDFVWILPQSSAETKTLPATKKVKLRKKNQKKKKPDRS